MEKFTLYTDNKNKNYSRLTLCKTYNRGTFLKWWNFKNCQSRILCHWKKNIQRGKPVLFLDKSWGNSLTADYSTVEAIGNSSGSDTKTPDGNFDLYKELKMSENG